MSLKPQLNLLVLKDHNIYHQLQLEEALFRTHQENWCLLNDGTTPAIVVGKTSCVHRAITNSRYQQFPLPIIRRFTGGGTVVVDENSIICSFILNTKSSRCPTTMQELIHWIHELLAPAFLPYRLEVSEHDYTIENKKVGGNAQTFSKDRIVHHISFLWSWEQDRMDLLTHPEKQPHYRQQRPHESFCSKLKKYFPSRQQLIQQCIRSFQQQFICVPVSFKQTTHIQQYPHRTTVEKLSLPFI